MKIQLSFGKQPKYQKGDKVSYLRPGIYSGYGDVKKGIIFRVHRGIFIIKYTIIDDLDRFYVVKEKDVLGKNNY